ncbi:4-hydroxy-tetrahydrodipicolinate reductase [Candidatus Omnitrophota bacterium]
MIKIAISGCMGKMGTRIRTLAADDEDLIIVSLLERKGHESIGCAIHELVVSEDVRQIENSDVLIEFTSPEATLFHLEHCVRFKRAMVIGTTGLSVNDIGKIEQAAKTIPIVFSPNMSVGVNILFRLVKEASEKLSKGYTVKVTEAHHIHKKDAPSGTAKRLAKVVQDASGQQVDDIQSVREGEIVGDHEVKFEGETDSITLSHSAKTRDIFVQGALVAAKFVATKEKGLFDMQAVLNELK